MSEDALRDSQRRSEDYNNRLRMALPPPASGPPPSEPPDHCWDCEHQRLNTCPGCHVPVAQCPAWNTNPAIDYGDSPRKKRALSLLSLPEGLAAQLRTEGSARTPAQRAELEGAMLERLDSTEDHPVIRACNGLHSVTAAEGIARWLHSPDCSPQARTLVRRAVRVDGSTEGHGGFTCSCCCDSGRISIDGVWAPCPRCQTTKKDTNE